MVFTILGNIFRLSEKAMLRMQYQSRETIMENQETVMKKALGKRVESRNPVYVLSNPRNTVLPLLLYFSKRKSIRNLFGSVLFISPRYPNTTSQNSMLLVTLGQY